MKIALKLLQPLSQMRILGVGSRDREDMILMDVVLVTQRQIKLLGDKAFPIEDIKQTRNDIRQIGGGRLVGSLGIDQTTQLKQTDLSCVDDAPLIGCIHRKDRFRVLRK